ncbi:hypothetical protein VTK26DRAFT_60 [Humicola hyalothermophila]
MLGEASNLRPTAAPESAAAPGSDTFNANGKRAAHDSPGPSSTPRDTPREKISRISRSRDQCHAKGRKCSGFKPCHVCITKGNTCTYDRPYKRGRPRTPPPPPDIGAGQARNLANPPPQGWLKEKGWASRSRDHCRTRRIACLGVMPCKECFRQRIQCAFKMSALSFWKRLYVCVSVRALD